LRRCPRCDLTNGDAATRCLRCGAALDPGRGVLVDNRYAVECELGRGAMGVVYRARDVSLDRPVAIKLISAELARNGTFVERFRREANALASIRNDHVVQVYTMGMHDGAYFYAMEYVEGRNLEQIVREHLKHGTTVPVYRALTILRQVALGLDAAHAIGLVHRDVKPANIVIEDRTGRPVLLDFGLARQRSRGSSTDTVTAGSPPYMAPEQIARDDDDVLGPPTDVYALGCTAFELLTGAPPFAGEGIYAVLRQQMESAAPLLSSRRPDLAMLDAVIARALEKSPSARYESAAAFAGAIETCATRWRSLGAPLSMPLTDAPARVELPHGERSNLTVLVVDDDAFFLKTAEAAATLAITDRPLEVIKVPSGIRALTTCLAQPPDLVVLDYDMPGANGIDTLSELRAIPGAAQATVLVVSASVGEVERWRFSVLGVRDFLAKPVEFAELVDAIRRLASFTTSPIHDTNFAPEPSAPSTSGLFEERLPAAVFLVLLAVGWADGRLDDDERDAVLMAAEVEGLDEAELAKLRAAAVERVELDSIDVSRLRLPARNYVYAVARWIALLDGELSEREAAALRILGFVLRMAQQRQVEIDTLVRGVIDTIPARDTRAMIVALRDAVRSKLRAEPDAPR
jgi:serine/threonine protein kinase/DNA-binding response OmpR family regulator